MLAFAARTVDRSQGCGVTSAARQSLSSSQVFPHQNDLRRF
ncbi:CRAT isoform 4 [Pan troglodytes]|uniref:Carnitine O-acetyltransferase n=3 Tax=Homininae TaxID=207598 RepID=F2Z2C5_HUMAN|nr:CRAT isoform 3 [Pan troglodytes]PNI68959.1 CRAT isoform 4 [Pan troglodytes]